MFIFQVKAEAAIQQGELVCACVIQTHFSCMTSQQMQNTFCIIDSAGKQGATSWTYTIYTETQAEERDERRTADIKHLIFHDFIHLSLCNQHR